eukprot:NODE_638_length_1472_cov_304.738580_g479_i0.p1 GENE.NODE_638_length_1472_cov_304.738580_g479_i0~~NODE_638_length_1472_cov_304.738580_g479_i0.p1  ORF type:complete len:421 (-),score=105.90 NODE_638_length_1472_cov_304.738580_g479_i0:133-1395(-)
MPNANTAAVTALRKLAAQRGLDVGGGLVRRTSSRFCLGVEHGDYNGTQLFGVGTDRFIWMAYKPNGTNRIRHFSQNFPDEGVVEFELGRVPPPQDPTIADSWGRFAYGCDHVLQRSGFPLTKGFDAVICGNIPGGGMSRSASLTLNLMLTMMEVNGMTPRADDFNVVEMAQTVETSYIGAPCGVLDQAMIYFAKAGMGTHFDPKTKAITHIPLGLPGGLDFRMVALDTGTTRHGLEKSTYAVRRAECDELVELVQQCKTADISCLADVKDEAMYSAIMAAHAENHPHLCRRLQYIYYAQRRFATMMEAWKAGDIVTLGRVFREDGHGLRDQYQITGPELETMVDIARTVPGVLGERMLGGGDKGASGALMVADAEEALRRAVDTGYPRAHPDYTHAMHVLQVVDGVTVEAGLLDDVSRGA